jgi:formylglycine-generating enzyme required for sulfatase activity
MLEYLTSIERYSELDAGGVAVLADLVAERGVIPIGDAGFSFVSIERFACGSPIEVAHWIAVYRHVLTGLEFALVPAGRFEMGRLGHNQRPGYYYLAAREVRLTKPFLMARTPCTEAAWATAAYGKSPTLVRGADYPIERKTWNSVSAWCTRAGLELPTEAQWEYACRSRTTTDFQGGDELSSVARHSWCVINSGHQMQPVGRLAPNAFGLFDMIGNVNELCRDDFISDQTATESRVDPIDIDTSVNSKVARGGNYDYGTNGCEVITRSGGTPSRAYPKFGFRPSLTLTLPR